MRCSTPLVFLAPPLSLRARASQVQVPLSPSRRILCLTSRIVSHCAAAQLWPVLTDCAMETGDLSLLQEPQISRSIEAGGWGRGRRRRPAAESRPDSHWKALLPRLSRRYAQDHTHANTLTPPRLFPHNGRLGRMCGRDHIVPPPFRLWWFPGEVRTAEEEKMDRTRFAGGLTGQRR